MSRNQERTKRIIDLFVGLVCLVASLFLIIPAAILIKLEDGGPIIFRQIRVGKDGKLFVMYKLRSMKLRVGEDRDDHWNRMCSQWKDKVPDDFVFKMAGSENPQVTRIGQFIRKTSIDELPQLWNVVIGNMSLIGPRPEVPDIVNYYNLTQRHRLKVKPGITGWAQINGRSEIHHGLKIELDNYYVDYCSILLDIKIFFMTLVRVIKKEGAV